MKNRERPVFVADGQLGGLDVGARLRVHDRILENAVAPQPDGVLLMLARAETA